MQIRPSDRNGEMANPNNGLHSESDNDGQDELCKEVVGIFNAQKTLLVVSKGSEKSSLINTFNAVLHLSDPTYHWMEWTAKRLGKTGMYNENPATLPYRKYCTERLYKDYEKILGKMHFDKCPTLLDAAKFFVKLSKYLKMICLYILRQELCLKTQTF